MRRGSALAILGIVSSSTPSLNCALMASVCTFSGSVNVRTNLPLTRSTRE